jgi:hypothetical protein
MSFTRSCEDALLSFLQTAVVIDDDAYDFCNTTDVPTIVQTPGRKVFPPISDTPAQRQAGKLDSKCLVKSFSAWNIICSVIEPNIDEDIVSYSQFISKSDIIILDWKIRNDDGDCVIKLIQKIIENSINSLRLICIYTSEPDLNSVIHSIQQKINNLKLIKKSDTFCLTMNSTFITIFNKCNTLDSNDPIKNDKLHNERKISEDWLPFFIVSEFSKFTAGLLSNAVLHIMGAIRRNAYALIGKFSPDIDTAFVSHTLYSKPLDDSKNHIVPIILSEINSIIQQNNCCEHVSRDKIEEWFFRKGIPNTNNIEQKIFLPKGMERAFLKYILRNGIPSSREIKNEILKYEVWINAIEELEKSVNIRKSLLTKFLGEKHGDIADRKLSALMSLENVYKVNYKVLRLGTIVRVGEKYFICIQPTCDSLRIPTSGRKFIFLQLNKVNGPDLHFNFTVREDDKFIELQIDPKPFNISIYEYSPTNINGEVVSHMENGYHIFGNHKKNEVQLIWIGQLKEIHAQRVVNGYAAKISRVGVTEYDWLRRCSSEN